MRAFLICFVAVTVAAAGCSNPLSTSDVEVVSEETLSCGTTVSASLDMTDPDTGIRNKYGVTWVQVADGFEVSVPDNVKITGGVIMDPLPENQMRKAFKVLWPAFGRKIHLTYGAFPMGNHGILCIERR